MVVGLLVGEKPGLVVGLGPEEEWVPEVDAGESESELSLDSDVSELYSELSYAF